MSIEEKAHHDQEGALSDLSGRTTIVVGASRGLGRGIATAFAEDGARVVADAPGRKAG
jgi:NAD(P)-dependent dehydrogenase (short-subunit alcohol dehydrogenase family)